MEAERGFKIITAPQIWLITNQNVKAPLNLCRILGRGTDAHPKIMKRGFWGTSEISGRPPKY